MCLGNGAPHHNPHSGRNVDLHHLSLHAGILYGYVSLFLVFPSFFFLFSVMSNKMVIMMVAVLN